jgi:hypothetical protein
MIATCARKAWERRMRCLYITETFRRNSVGNLIPPGRAGQQPEASLACSGGETHTTKRRQQALRPEHRAPKSLSLREPLACCSLGAESACRIGLACRSRRGPRPGHRCVRVAQEPGRPCGSILETAGVGQPDPKLQALWSASDWMGETKAGAREMVLPTEGKRRAAGRSAGSRNAS